MNTKSRNEIMMAFGFYFTMFFALDIFLILTPKEIATLSVSVENAMFGLLAFLGALEISKMIMPICSSWLFKKIGWLKKGE